MVADRGAFLFAWSRSESRHTNPVNSRSTCCCALALLLSSCVSKDPSTTPIEGTEHSPDGPSYLVGIVEFVNPDQRFVLVKTQGATAIPAGAKLTALDATGSLSEIVVSPERKGTHLTADIASGSPRAGNLVVYQPNKGTAPAQRASAPAGSVPDVEWREGQPPPLEIDPPPPLPPQDSPIPLQPTSPIPLEPPPVSPP